MRSALPVLFTSLLTFLVAASPGPAAGDPLPGPPSGAIALPQPVMDGTMSLEKALQERRSVRQYAALPLSLSDLSQLLWAAQGVTGAGGKRTAPSAGALYPLELSAIAGKVTGLAAGVYAYDPRRHELKRIADGDARDALSGAAFGQPSIRNAPAVIALFARYERTTVKYGERGIRYVHMEAGHAAQNVQLQAVARRLGTVVIGAFDDEGVRKVLRLTDREHPLYLIPIGNEERRGTGR